MVGIRVVPSVVAVAVFLAGCHDQVADRGGGGGGTTGAATGEAPSGAGGSPASPPAATGGASGRGGVGGAGDAGGTAGVRATDGLLGIGGTPPAGGAKGTGGTTREFSSERGTGGSSAIAGSMGGRAGAASGGAIRSGGAGGLIGSGGIHGVGGTGTTSGGRSGTGGTAPGTAGTTSATAGATGRGGSGGHGGVQTSCPGTSPAACGSSCVDCAASTGTGSQCIHGACICNAGARSKICAGACVDLDTDRLNCGDCGQACGAAHVCSDGKCSLECGGATPDLCHGGCVKAGSDVHACGRGKCLDCDSAEAGRGSVCIEGICTCNLGARPATCGGTCVDLNTDRMNCGACGQACGPAEVCNDHQCTLECGGASPDLCHGGCVSADTDARACGKGVCLDCDSSSAGRGSVCIHGTCTCNEGTRPKTCDGNCVDLATNRLNCGECGHACGPAEVCSDGECGLECGGSTPHRCRGGCVNADTNADACGQGACVDCAASSAGRGSVCISGSCTCTLGARPAACTGVCVDLAADRLNCGDCGHACGPAELCSGGSCQLECGGGTPDLCRGGCVNSEDNPHACGKGACLDCDATTGVGSICRAGTCVCARGADPETCGTTCVDRSTDRQNCGACGHACRSGEVCSDGQCQLECGGNTPQLCRGGCVNAQTDAHACGSACLDCDGRSGIGSACVDGTCTCNLGSRPMTCGSRCVDLDHDIENCGGCGRACAYANATTACSGGECRVVACAPGFGNADGVEANGCECRITNLGVEACDNIDNDCDGTTDWDLSGIPHSVCDCYERAVPLTRSEPFQSDRQIAPGYPRCRETTCELDADGALLMSYCFSTCDGVQEAPWAVCLFAGPVDLSGFDVDFGNDGVMEVVFDVLSSSAPGKLDLYYGHDPQRKYVTLIPRGEALAPGRYFRYVTPAQVRYPNWSPVPTACRDQCGPCSAIHDIPDFVFSAADVTLAGEGCAEPVDARIRLVRMNVLGRGCGCTGNSNCVATPERPVCRAPDSGTGTCGWPASFAPGMCAMADTCDTTVPLGSPCTINVGSTSCSGTWQCQNGGLVCRVETCSP